MPDTIALLNNKTFLMHKNASGKWEKLVSITKYPQPGGERERVEVTRLDDTKKRYILGLEDVAALTFEANYLKDEYDKVNALSGTLGTYSLCFGDQMGTDGRWEWTGDVSVYVNEGESGGARKMTLTFSDEGDEAITEADPLTSDELAA